MVHTASLCRYPFASAVIGLALALLSAGCTSGSEEQTAAPSASTTVAEAQPTAQQPTATTEPTETPLPTPTPSPNATPTPTPVPLPQLPTPDEDSQVVTAALPGLVDMQAGYQQAELLVPDGELCPGVEYVQTAHPSRAFDGVRYVGGQTGSDITIRAFDSTEDAIAAAEYALWSSKECSGVEVIDEVTGTLFSTEVAEAAPHRPTYGQAIYAVNADVSAGRLSSTFYTVAFVVDRFYVASTAYAGPSAAGVDNAVSAGKYADLVAERLQAATTPDSSE